MLRSFRTMWLGFAGALALAGCATAPGVDTMRPALWQVADSDTTIYLFGTIHTLPPGVNWRTPALDAAMAASEELVTEIVIPSDPAGIAAAAAPFMRLAMARGLPPVLERVPADKRDTLREAIAGIGIPVQALDSMKTWAAAFMIAQASFQRAGLDPELGVERSLSAIFRERGRSESGLESIEQQLGYFDSLPEDDQRAFLVGVLESPEEIRREFDRMLAAWTSGNTNAIARTFDDEKTISPRLRATLITERNARWTEWLQRRLDRPGTIFVAVGAGHLAGRDSVQSMLERRGLRVQRVQ